EAGLNAARDGRQTVFVVAGEAGVGKTRFIHEVATHAASAGVLVLEGGCLAVGGEVVPFGPIVEALRSLSRALSPEHLAEVLGPDLIELSRLLPPSPARRSGAGGRLGPDDVGQGR